MKKIYKIYFFISKSLWLPKWYKTLFIPKRELNFLNLITLILYLNKYWKQNLFFYYFFLISLNSQLRRILYIYYIFTK